MQISYLENTSDDIADDLYTESNAYITHPAQTFVYTNYVL